MTLTTADYTWKAVNNQVEQTIDGVTFNFKGGSAQPTYYNDGLRTYEGCVITISSESNITKIDFTYTIDNNGKLTLTSSEGTWKSSSKSWTGSANSVALKVGHSSGTKNGQVRITKIVVTTGAPLAHYKVSWTVNGADYNEGYPSTDVIDGSKVTLLPTAPSAINDKVFVGWTDKEISKSQDNAPSVLFNTPSSAPAVTANTTYYAVFATQSGNAPVETLSQTLVYDTWTYSGSTTNKSSYRLFHANSYIESAEFDLSTLSKVVVYGGTFGGSSYKNLNIGDGTNTWKNVTVSGSSETGVNTYTNGTALSGIGKLRITSQSGTASGNGVRISKVEIYNTQGGYTYSGYATTINVVSTDPSSNLILSQTTGEVNVDKTLDISGYVSTADGYTGTVTYAVTEGTEYASVSEAGVITGLAVGTATVKVTAPAIVGSFSESSAEFTVTVVENRTATTVTFGLEVDDKTFDVNPDETFEGKTATVSPAEAGSVTYSSDNTEVASVNESTGAITIRKTAGKATITAYFAATDNYQASYAKYYINVIDPNAPVFYESFNLNDGTGGNDEKWSGSIATNDLRKDNTGWTVKNGNGASQCARFGTGSALGSATTPAIDLSGNKYILTFKAGAWNAKDEKTTINVVISNGTLTYKGTSSSTQTIEMNKAAWTDYTMTIAGATNSTTIKFTAKSNSDNRFFLDEVKIVKAQAPATRTLSLVAVDNDIYYATFSSSEDVIFPSDVEVDAVSVEVSTLKIKELAQDDYFVKATSADGYDVVSNGYYVPANTGVLIQSLTNTVTYYYPYEEAAVSLPANQLKPAPAEGGEFTPEPGDHLYYKLAYNDFSEKEGLGFYWGAAYGGVFSVKAGTAYLAVPSTGGSSAKGFCFSGTTTGINNIDATETGKTREIYNLAGQKMNTMGKPGMYIVNGKKTIIRK